MGKEKCPLSVLSGLNIEKMYGLSPGTKRNVHNNGVSVPFLLIMTPFDPPSWICYLFLKSQEKTKLIQNQARKLRNANDVIPCFVFFRPILSLVCLKTK